MINLNPEFCHKIRDARRSAGLSQSALAAEMGCKQSAISMFEQGDGTKLNDEVIERLAEKFGVELPKDRLVPAPVKVGPSNESSLARSLAASLPRPVQRGFCPNPNCPSHTVYQVEDMTYLRPDRSAQDPVGGKFCAVCGEVLEKKCPNCGAPVHDGAICSLCGEPYVAVS